MDRRGFLKTCAAGAAVLMAAPMLESCTFEGAPVFGLTNSSMVSGDSSIWLITFDTDDACLIYPKARTTDVAKA